MHCFFAGHRRRNAGRPEEREDAAAAHGLGLGGRARAQLRAGAAALHALRRVPLRRLQVAARLAQGVIGDPSVETAYSVEGTLLHGSYRRTGLVGEVTFGKERLSSRSYRVSHDECKK